MGNCWFVNDPSHPEKMKSEANLSSPKDTTPMPRTETRKSEAPPKQPREPDQQHEDDGEEQGSNGSRLQQNAARRALDRAEDAADSPSAMQDLESGMQSSKDDRRSLYQVLHKKSILSLPLRSIYDDSIVFNVLSADQNEVKIEYLNGLKKDLLPRGHIVELSNRPEVTLLDDIIETGADREDLGLAKISREEDGFAIDFNGCENFRIRVNKVCFFLDQNCELVLGDPLQPEASLAVSYLDFPKLRVNFNGFRIKTNERNVNWSNYYMINEKNQNKSGLHLRDASKEEGQATFVLDEKNKYYYIGSEESCKIKTKKGGVLGFIKFLEDVGWIIQARDPLHGSPREELVYGLYIRLRSGLYKFKLYQGMTFLVGAHLLTVKELA